jgi:hypothetical protein
VETFCIILDHDIRLIDKAANLTSFGNFLLSGLDQVRTIVMGGKSLFMYKSAVLSL